MSSEYFVSARIPLREFCRSLEQKSLSLGFSQILNVLLKFLFKAALQTFSAKDQVVNMFAIAGFKASVAPTQLCHRGRKAATGAIYMKGGYVPKKIFICKNRLASPAPNTASQL